MKRISKRLKWMRAGILAEAALLLISGALLTSRRDSFVPSFFRQEEKDFIKKRYYYYAHLRQNFPYAKCLKTGSVVTAGDIIGYMGHTGYSAKENVNNIDTVHLHFGLQLIFDESQKEGESEIWVNCYELTKFLSRNRTEAVKNPATKEWSRVCGMRDPAAAAWDPGVNAGPDSEPPRTTVQE